MLRNTIKLNLGIFLFLFSVESASCGNVPSKRDVELWFYTNESMLMNIMEYVKKDSSIKRIEPELRYRFVPRYGEPSKYSREVYEIIAEVSRRNGIKNIEVTRDIEGDGALSSMRFVIYSVGSVVSEKSAFAAISYTEDKSIIKTYSNHNTKVEYLRGNWYYVHRCD